MKNFIFILVVTFCLISCIDETQKVAKVNDKDNDISHFTPPTETLNNFRKWWSYHNKYVDLSKDYIALNVDGDTMEKRKFLKNLSSGKYIPFKSDSIQKQLTYQLLRLEDSDNKGIKSTMKNAGATYLHHLDMEGKMFPQVNLVDLNGRTFTNEGLKGKTTIIKTWFINCTACIAEFPELNELVAKYEENSRVQFISLALDDDNELTDFLSSKKLKYKTVGGQLDLIQEQLGLSAYPTHLVVGEDGRITKILSRSDQLIDYLENDYDLDGVSTRSEDQTLPTPLP